MKRNKGFTLIELLVVIAIIAILASIIMVSLSSSKEKANDSKALSQLKQMQSQAELYTGNRGNYQSGSDCHAEDGTLFSESNNGIGGLLKGINLANSRCFDNPDGSWAVAVSISGGKGALCADSTGVVQSKTPSGAIVYTSPQDAINNNLCKSENNSPIYD